ncbi:3-oxosteroid 1-dehydrogenase [bacterium HR39]|nr:3-oxosteroid 1-dehydrogenase [bacterium HR39]
MVGSGVAGLVAALVAALEGARPLVVERAATIGGTGARSSGTLWIPDNHHLRAAGIRGDRERARTYLLALGGDRVDAALLDAFLDGGPAMLLDLERRAGIAFRPYPQAADYRQDVPGAASGFRALEPPVFDGRRLGRDFARIEPPIPELALPGGRLMITRAEAARLARIGDRISCHQPMARVEAHAHRVQEQVYHVLEGEGLMEIEGERVVVRRHDVVFLPPGTRHAIENTGLVDLVFLVVTSPVEDLEDG